MELAVVGGHPTREQQHVRLKLHFEDATILSVQQIHEGLCDSWFLLGGHLHSIADLASHVAIAFGLRSSCPHGISLQMENFTLPPSQPVGLLKDKDIVSVIKKRTPLTLINQQGEHPYSSSFDTFDKIAPLGVKTHALEEFERETGGYESEKEEENGTCEIMLKDINDKAPKPSSTKSRKKKRQRAKVESVNRKDDQVSASCQQVKHADSPRVDIIETLIPLGIKTKEFKREIGGYNNEEGEGKHSHKTLQKDVNDKSVKASTTKSKEKKRKREKLGRIEEQGLEVVPYMGGNTNLKDEQKEIKKRRIVDQQVELEKLQCFNERQECHSSREGHKSECSKAAKTEKEKKDKTISDKGDNLVKEQTAEKQGMVIHSKKNRCLSISDSSSEEEVEDKEKTPGLRKEGEFAKKCSRSTLRKKAKRRWRRENLEETSNISCKPGNNIVKGAVDEVDADRQVRLTFPAKHEDDGDAEEERLPRVVRRGHIRFQVSDEDDNDILDPHLNPSPFLDWSNGISKRKGQSWGQEKTKRGNNNFQAMGDMEIDDTQELNVETLPAIEGTPQNGDVIAYRILELTSSYCPELSEYRVGKVFDLDSQSGKLKLADVPKYALHRRNDYNQPIHEDGVLETEISSLAHIRLVERGLRETEKLASSVQASVGMSVNDNEASLNLPVDLSKICDANLNLSKADSETEKSDSPSLEGWLEISEALQRKREELGRKEQTVAALVTELENDKELEIKQDITLTGIVELRNDGELEKKQETTSTRIAEPEKPKIESGATSAGKRSSNGASTGRARGWHKRAGGLGSTMALLRQQNVM